MDDLTIRVEARLASGLAAAMREERATALFAVRGRKKVAEAAAIPSWQMGIRASWRRGCRESGGKRRIGLGFSMGFGGRLLGGRGQRGGWVQPVIRAAGKGRTQ